jgi:hypothetical protein
VRNAYGKGRGLLVVLVVVADGVMGTGAGHATDVAPPTPGPVSSIETRFLTHFGEGAAGRRRVFRNGCYQSESRGGTGGGQAKDSQAGCTTPSIFAAMFAKADEVVAAGVLVPENLSEVTKEQSAQHVVTALDDTSVGLHPVVVCDDGRRLVAKDKQASQLLERVVGMEPSIDPWYVTPPKPALSAGAQMIALSARKIGRSGEGTLQASLVASGSWWCHRSIPTLGAAAPTTVSRPTPKPLPPARAAAILDRVLAGISARALAADEAEGLAVPERDIQVEAAVGLGPRTAVRSTTAVTRVATRFGDEMRAQSSACVPPGP